MSADIIYDLPPDSSGSANFTFFGGFNTATNTNVSNFSFFFQSRGYYNYDLSGITEGLLTSATLTLDVSSLTGTPSVSFNSFDYDPSETAQQLFNSIGGGTLLNNVTISSTGIININFDAAALAEIMNSYGGLLSIGMLSNTNFTALTFNDLNARLTLNVAPEVGEVMLMLIGLSVLLFFHISRRKSTQAVV